MPALLALDSDIAACRGVLMADLFTHLEAETWLAQRLKDHNCDIYADRLGAAIVRNRLQCVVAGRNPDTRKSETYSALFERIAGKKLPKHQL